MTVVARRAAGASRHASEAKQEGGYSRQLPNMFHDSEWIPLPPKEVPERLRLVCWPFHNFPFAALAPALLLMSRNAPPHHGLLPNGVQRVALDGAISNGIARAYPRHISDLLRLLLCTRWFQCLAHAACEQRAPLDSGDLLITEITTLADSDASLSPYALEFEKSTPPPWFWTGNSGHGNIVVAKAQVRHRLVTVRTSRCCRPTHQYKCSYFCAYQAIG